MATHSVKKRSRAKPDFALLLWVFVVLAICTALFGPMAFMR
jgi:ABC-type enterochelin transport system permease subunit